MAVSLIEAQYTWGRVADMYEALYEALGDVSN